jgi:predicted RNA binding protein YcfA (HicA-like mRNA interferase family)
MKNSQFNTHDVKQRCERKLDIAFKGSNELNGWFMLNDKKVARITVPHGRKVIPPKTYKSMATQLKLTTDEFDALLECPLDRQMYESIIKAQIPGN